VAEVADVNLKGLFLIKIPKNNMVIIRSDFISPISQMSTNFSPMPVISENLCEFFLAIKT